MRSGKTIETLEAENTALRQQVVSLEEKVMVLLQRLEDKSVQKDSHNSHNPPSQDKVRKTKSLRSKSERKSGGQPGHPGKTLEMVCVPDQVKELKSSYCQVCGISEGSISNLLPRAARKVSPIYEQIQAALEQATYVGSDETESRQTGAKVNGKNAWIWVWQNLKNTFLKASPSPGSQTVAAAAR